MSPDEGALGVTVRQPVLEYGIELSPAERRGPVKLMFDLMVLGLYVGLAIVLTALSVLSAVGVAMFVHSHL